MTELTSEFVEALVRRLFGAAESRTAMEILERYGREPHEHEAVRVRVAALKLCGGDLGRLDGAVEHARRDYRDVLAWAEYPEELAHPTWRMPQDEVSGMRKRDLAQYRAWLEANGWRPDAL